MHPGMIAWWKWKHSGHSGHHEHGHHEHGGGHHHHHAEAGCGPSGEGAGEAFAGFGGPDGFDSDFGGGSFGVRRPLRFLAHKLELDEKQVAELAHVLNELKTERAQAAVDHRRTVAGFADVIAGEAFDEGKASGVAARARQERRAAARRRGEGPRPDPRAPARGSAGQVRVPDPHGRAHALVTRIALAALAARAAIVRGRSRGPWRSKPRRFALLRRIPRSGAGGRY